MARERLGTSYIPYDSTVDNYAAEIRALRHELRMVKENLPATQGGERDGNSTVDNTVIIQPGVIPVGGIIMWSGNSGNIPENWALCNGGSGTPDLRDRFIVGSGTTYATGDTGGSTTKDISHTHGPGTLNTDNDTHDHLVNAGTTANESAHTHTEGTLDTANESSHTHTDGSLATGNESSHTHADGTLANANESTHSHTEGTISAGNEASHTHAFGDVSSGPSATTTFGNSNTPPGPAKGDGTHTHSVSGTTGVGSSHTHTVSGTSSGGSAHTHTISGDTAAGTAHNHSVSGTTDAGTAHNHSVSGTTSAGSSHSHGPGSLDTDNDTHDHDVDSGVTATGGSAAQDILPPYYALAFIMRVA